MSEEYLDDEYIRKASKEAEKSFAELYDRLTMKFPEYAVVKGLENVRN